MPTVNVILTSAILECVPSEDLFCLTVENDVFAQIAQRILKKRVHVDVQVKADCLVCVKDKDCPPSKNHKSLYRKIKTAHLRTLAIPKFGFVPMSREEDVPINEFLEKKRPNFTNLEIDRDFFDDPSTLNLVLQSLRSPFLRRINALVKSLHGGDVMSHFQNFVLRGDWVHFKFSHRHSAFFKYKRGTLWTQSIAQQLLESWKTADAGKLPWKRFETEIEDDGHLIDLVGENDYEDGQVTSKIPHPTGNVSAVITLCPLHLLPQLFSLTINFQCRK